MWVRRPLSNSVALNDIVVQNLTLLTKALNHTRAKRLNCYVFKNAKRSFTYYKPSKIVFKSISP